MLSNSSSRFNIDQNDAIATTPIAGAAQAAPTCDKRIQHPSALDSGLCWLRCSDHGPTRLNNGLGRVLLREVKDDGIKVSLINPGIIDTDFGGGHEGSAPAHASLASADLARLILAIVEQPANVVVDELMVHPLRQADF